MHLDNLRINIVNISRRAAGGAESMVLLIQREWPVYQLSTKIVDPEISSGACLSYMITISHKQLTLFVPRSRVPTDGSPIMFFLLTCEMISLGTN